MGIKDIIFPKPTHGRIHPKDPFWDGKKKSFVIAVTSTFILLQLLFLGNLSYVNGALWRDGDKVHALKVLMIDYDQGVIGQSLRTAYTSLKADTFPTLVEHNVSEYANPAAAEHAVFIGDYWAAIYVHHGASDRLAAALQGGDAAANYNASDTITYIVNEVRYPTTVQGNIESNMQTLIGVTRVIYNSMSGATAMQSIANDRAASLALLNPITASTVNIKATTQGPRVIYNTISIVFPIIAQFFFLMGINSISGKFQLYSHLPLLNNGLIRLALSTSYTLIGALCTSSYIYIFRETWHLSAGQFVLTWLTYWLYMHVNFLVLDCATGFIPLSFLPFFVLTWVVLNVTSTLVPFELSPGFYRWGYALPAHETYQVLVTVWSGGAAYKRLREALPVLFAWEVVVLPLAVVALHHRCQSAANAARAAEEAILAKVRAKELGGEAASARTGSVVSSGAQGEVVREKARDGEEYFPSSPTPFRDTLESVARRI